MARYEVYPGKFVCQVCDQDVHSLRLYSSEKRMTWMCRQKHLSEVDLNTKKKKRDYERKK